MTRALNFYFGDGWKVRHNLTVTAGLHYGRDTGRADSDLPAIPAIAKFNNQFFQNLQDKVNLPSKNFGPQIGIAWDPWGTGKTVIRAGAGLYYENAIFNNVLFDRPARLTRVCSSEPPRLASWGRRFLSALPAGGSLNS